MKAKRPLVEPNPSFMRALRAFEPELLAQPAPLSYVERRLREGFAQHDLDRSGGLSVAELRSALIGNGQPANLARRLVEEHDGSGRGALDVDSFIRAWHAEGLGLP